MKGDYATISKVKDSIDKWQNSEYVHPLTCGNNSLHSILIPQISYDGNEFELNLKCLDCNWTQDIPPSFIGKRK